MKYSKYNHQNFATKPIIMNNRKGLLENKYDFALIRYAFRNSNNKKKINFIQIKKLMIPNKY